MRNKGFTLIELLVVIAIIGLLLAIIAPALKKAKTVAKRIVCMTNVRSFGQAFNVYAADHDDKVIQLYFQIQGKILDGKTVRVLRGGQVTIVPRGGQAHGGDTSDARQPGASNDQ